MTFSSLDRRGGSVERELKGKKIHYNERSCYQQNMAYTYLSYHTPFVRNSKQGLMISYLQRVGQSGGSYRHPSFWLRTAEQAVHLHLIATYIYIQLFFLACRLPKVRNNILVYDSIKKKICLNF